MKINLDKDKLDTYISITHTTIVICWVTLICYWIIKLLGGNWFEIVVHNENFVKFSQYVQTSWLKYLVSFITMFVGNYLLLGAIAQKFLFKGKELAIVIAILVSIWVVSNFVPLSFLNLGFWYGYAVIIIFALFYQKGKKKLLGILSVVLDFVFSSISMLTRNVRLYTLDDYLITMILIIDLYIMYALYYLYSNLLNLKRR